MKILITESNKEKIQKELDTVQARCKAQFTDINTIYEEADKLKAAIKCFINIKDIHDVTLIYSGTVQSDMPKSYKYPVPTTCFILQIVKGKTYLTNIYRDKGCTQHRKIMLAGNMQQKFIDSVKKPCFLINIMKFI